ncbi:MAG: transporter associated domain-containing protein, partial [Humibacter sp.]
TLRPDEVKDRTGIDIPDDGPYETVAGYVMNELDRLPVVGDEVRVGGGMLRVERLDGRRVDTLRFTPDPDESDDHGDSGDGDRGNPGREPRNARGGSDRA